MEPYHRPNHQSLARLGRFHRNATTADVSTQILIIMSAYPIRYSALDIKSAISDTAQRLTKEGVLTSDTVYIVLLNGGVWFASHLFDALQEPSNEVYYISCHSYHGKTRGELKWDYLPELPIQDKDVVVLDDICDSGQTATAVVRYLNKTAKRVSILTLLKRSTTCLDEDIRLYSCITDPTADFFVGCGLDDNGKNRMLPYIGIVEK
jgi:hypoxanthine phosphoribosyltransferase